MKKKQNLQTEETQALNIPVVVRWLIMLVCCILIGIIWLIQIPWSLFITLPTGYFLHEFDMVMQPYYWFEKDAEIVEDEEEIKKYKKLLKNKNG